MHDESGEIESGDGFERGEDPDQRVIGDDGFLARVLERPVSQARFSTLDEVVAAVCGEHDIRGAQLKDATWNRRFAKIRAEIAKLANEARVATLSEVARRFGRSDAVICRSIRRYFAAEINEHQ